MLPVLVLVVDPTPAAPAPASSGRATPLLSGGLHDAGVGTYTDASVAHQVSNFTINERMVSCGVGTVAPGGPSSGPFAMLMYATEIRRYDVERSGNRRILVEGRMRSITRMAGLTVEDAEHDFLAAAVDGRGEVPDRFDVHFATPLWSPQNPMATPSAVHPGWVRFGGAVIADPDGRPLGDIVVDG
jgi:hypothetical protein